MDEMWLVISGIILMTFAINLPRVYIGVGLVFMGVGAVGLVYGPNQHEIICPIGAFFLFWCLFYAIFSWLFGDSLKAEEVSKNMVAFYALLMTIVFTILLYFFAVFVHRPGP